MSTGKYLDYNGLSYFWGKVKNYIDSHSGGGGGCPYEVGDIYITTKTANPSTVWSGTTWEQIKGRFLVAAGNNGASGDEALNLTVGGTGGETNHKLTAAESGVPAHTHKPGSGTYFSTGSATFAKASNKAATGSSGISDIVRETGTLSNPTATANNTAASASSAHNNLPPYLAVNMWKRLT